VLLDGLEPAVTGICCDFVSEECEDDGVEVFCCLER
jgi:hypothetical protein